MRLRAIHTPFIYQIRKLEGKRFMQTSLFFCKERVFITAGSVYHLSGLNTVLD